MALTDRKDSGGGFSPGPGAQGIGCHAGRIDAVPENPGRGSALLDEHQFFGIQVAFSVPAIGCQPFLASDTGIDTADVFSDNKGAVATAVMAKEYRRSIGGIGFRFREKLPGNGIIGKPEFAFEGELLKGQAMRLLPPANAEKVVVAAVVVIEAQVGRHNQVDSAGSLQDGLGKGTPRFEYQITQNFLGQFPGGKFLFQHLDIAGGPAGMDHPQTIQFKE